MPQFRHHTSGQINVTTSDDDTDAYEADPMWQRLDDGDAAAELEHHPEPEREQTIDDVIEQLGYAGADRRNLLRDALASFDDASQLPAVDLFDPSSHSVAEVQAYLKSLDPDALAECQRVIDAEKSGQARKGVLDLAPTTTT